MFNKRDIRTFSMLGSRRAFWYKITESAAQDENLIVMTADLSRGNGLEKFQQNYPEQFYNVGIAEQNMIGIAAGMAKVGMNVFATTFSTFITARCFDQIRINLGYMNFPIKLVGRGSGLCNATAGPSHYAVEDFSIMRSLSNITVATPADAFEAVKLAEAAVNYNQPMYVRLNDSVNTPAVYKDDYDFEIGKAIVLQEGADITIFATGTMVYQALQTAKMLADENISAAVVNIHTIKPLDIETIKKYSADKKFIVSVEEHNKIGGLGSAIAEIISEQKNSPQLFRIGLPDCYIKAASYEFLLNKYNLTAEKICATIKQKFSEG